VGRPEHLDSRVAFESELVGPLSDSSAEAMSLSQSIV
jgi:hypothetical protein